MKQPCIEELRIKKLLWLWTHPHQLRLTDQTLRRTAIKSFKEVSTTDWLEQVLNLITKPICYTKVSKEWVHSSFTLGRVSRLWNVHYYTVNHLNRSPWCRAISFAAFKHQFVCSCYRSFLYWSLDLEDDTLLWITSIQKRFITLQENWPLETVCRS